MAKLGDFYSDREHMPEVKVYIVMQYFRDILQHFKLFFKFLMTFIDYLIIAGKFLCFFRLKVEFSKC